VRTDAHISARLLCSRGWKGAKKMSHRRASLSSCVAAHAYSTSRGLHTAAGNGYNSAGSPLFAEWLQLHESKLCGDLSRGITSDDALIVVDMQADFVPKHPQTNPDGGRFGVAEGDHVIQPIVKLMDVFLGKGATIVATRDYHPHDHVSFTDRGGPFPAHCVQGTRGSHFLGPIGDKLLEGLKQPGGTDRVLIAFKAFHEETDSFGAFPYTEGGDGRICKAPGHKHDEAGVLYGCAAAPWTGSLILKASALHADDADVNAPPDVLALHKDGVDRRVLTLAQALEGKRRIFVCGLSLDYCVADTCINAAAAGFPHVSLVLDACRAAHIPGVGEFGTGFIQDPREVVKRLRCASVDFVPTETILSLRSDGRAKSIVRAHDDKRHRAGQRAPERSSHGRSIQLTGGARVEECAHAAASAGVQAAASRLT